MMLSVEDARARMLARVQRLQPETVALGALDERTLAGAVRAARDQPPFDAAVMDGYAYRAADAPGSLTIVGESSAGHQFRRALGAGEAVRISTGAPLPAGADAVLAQEDARFEAELLVAPATARGAYVRRRAGDFAAGEVLLEDGRVIDAGAVAAIAGAGIDAALVNRLPIVSILATGDELVAPGATPREDQIFDAASHAVASLVRAWGGVPRLAPLLPDAPAPIAAALTDALAASDLVVMIGGASVGPHDHVRPCVRERGGEMLVEGISVRPGRPTWFATFADHRFALGLPGNPASALVCTRLFAAPLLEKMLSGAQTRSLSISVLRLTEAMPANGSREAYVRAVAVGSEVTPIPNEDSSMMSVLARSNVLIRRASGAPPAAVGDCVDVVPWRQTHI